ncbi:TetR/AcrR family transcriptional regulator [Paenibacillus sp. JCM 10914]|uniref:TetR/AcrR family transcriptional regulator n=1 Tax=Paenibacillus sp. JCM 10914 TaxID=1236974 RepID=UPI0003CC959E|nr:TetR-like C-terminal domain-containing protein [Paenibacillus sp. JCM 10914]GAE07476.1 transcriptional regulator, TetR family [Paenibacillus sp. JCM 10914]
MNDQDQRVIKTKTALHQALVALLKTNALESISVSALCREASVNRGTFYLHYKDIGTLFDEHLNYLLKDLEESYYEPYRHVSLLIPNDLDPSTIRIFHHVKKYQSFYEIVFDKKSSLSYYYSLLEKIKALMLESSLKHRSDIHELSWLIAYQANAIMGLIIQWNEDGYKHTPEFMNEQLTYFLRSQDRETSYDRS